MVNFKCIFISAYEDRGYHRLQEKSRNVPIGTTLHQHQCSHQHKIEAVVTYNSDSLYEGAVMLISSVTIDIETDYGHFILY
jgi:hypothetical protein